MKGKAVREKVSGFSGALKRVRARPGALPAGKKRGKATFPCAPPPVWRTVLLLCLVFHADKLREQQRRGHFDPFYDLDCLSHFSKY